MDKTHLMVAVVVLSAMLALFLAGSEPAQDNEPKTQKNSGLATVCFENECISAEVADTSEKRFQGLMFREELGEKEGMLFVYTYEGKHGFWMKNTLIPLTMVWINKELEVVHLENAVPCEKDPCARYNTAADALYILEVNPEFAEQHVKVGSTVEIGLP